MPTTSSHRANRTLIGERICRHPIGRIIILAYIWIMASLYAFRFITSLWLSTRGLEGWAAFARQTVRDILIVLILFCAYHYFRNYSARRASLSLRRKDATIAAILVFSLSVLGFSWLPWWSGVLYGLLFSVFPYVWEMRSIRRLERKASQAN